MFQIAFPPSLRRLLVAVRMSSSKRSPPMRGFSFAKERPRHEDLTHRVLLGWRLMRWQGEYPDRPGREGATWPLGRDATRPAELPGRVERYALCVWMGQTVISSCGLLECTSSSTSSGVRRACEKSKATRTAMTPAAVKAVIQRPRGQWLRTRRTRRPRAKVPGAVTVDLKEIDDGTEMTFTQTGGNMPSENYAQAEAGWRSFFDDRSKGLSGRSRRLSRQRGFEVAAECPPLW